METASSRMMQRTMLRGAERPWIEARASTDVLSTQNRRDHRGGKGAPMGRPRSWADAHRAKYHRKQDAVRQETVPFQGGAHEAPMG
jgi:hypothetical protein